MRLQNQIALKHNRANLPDAFDQLRDEYITKGGLITSVHSKTENVKNEIKENKLFMPIIVSMDKSSKAAIEHFT